MSNSYPSVQMGVKKRWDKPVRFLPIWGISVDISVLADHQDRLRVMVVIASKLWYNARMEKKKIILLVLAFAAIMNVVSLVLMGHDKRSARQGKWRVPERRLFLATACFGGLGGVLGMKVFHHKTQHWYFKVFFPVLLVLQIVVLLIGAYLLMQ